MKKRYFQRDRKLEIKKKSYTIKRNKTNGNEERKTIIITTLGLYKRLAFHCPSYSNSISMHTLSCLIYFLFAQLLIITSEFFIIFYLNQLNLLHKMLKQSTLIKKALRRVFFFYPFPSLRSAKKGEKRKRNFPTSSLLQIYPLHLVRV